MRLSTGVANSSTKLLASSSKQMVREVSSHHGTIQTRKVICKKLKVKNSWNSLGSESTGYMATRVAKLGQKWMEYQGIKNWEGLLDPLDDGLRSEILRYGEFIEAAYRSFEFDTSAPGYSTCKYNKNAMLAQCGLGMSGYKVTRNLRATCGVEIPSWIDKGPNWTSTKSSWIGYVAVCDDKDEIARLGRRDVVIAFRGTATCLEWIENLRARLTCLPGGTAIKNSKPMVESGFLSLYTSATPTCPSLRDMVRNEISRILQEYGDGEPLSVTITGHSLGAALATLTAYDITSTFERSPLVTVVSFGGPRVGNRDFRSQLERTGTRILRIVNSTDLITKMPGFLIDNNDVATNGFQLPSWLQKRMEDKQWQYADVGKELRLSSNDSPFLEKRDIATCHDLKTYLHLVEGFVSSTCPFRATAKKFLYDRQQQRNKQQVLIR